MEKVKKGTLLQSICNSITGIIESSHAQRETEAALIQQVENYPVYIGARRDSIWYGFRIRSITAKNAEDALQAVKDGLKRMQEEYSPEQYRERWEEIFWYTRKLAAVENKVKFKGEVPSRLLRRLKLEYEPRMFDFLDRFTEWFIRHEISPLKTVNGKLNRAEKFIPKLDDLWAEMSEAARQRAYELDAHVKSRIEHGEI